MTGAETVLDAPLLGSRFHRGYICGRPVQTHCSTRWIMRMGVNARTPCRCDWRGGVLSYSAWCRQEHSDQAALPTLVLIDPYLDQPCQVPCSRIGSLADALAGGTSACDLPGVPTPVSLNEDTEDVIVSLRTPSQG